MNKKYCEKFDVHFNIQTGKYLESKCSDTKCMFCKNRPHNILTTCKNCKLRLHDNKLCKDVSI